jgi:predicted transcriptional regulator
MKVQRYGFHGERVVEIENVKIGWGMRTAMILLAVLCLATSILVIPGIRETTLDPVVNAIMDKTGYIARVMGR